MKHLFLSCALSLKAKEKGFDQPCLAYYTNRYGGGTEHPTPIHQHEGSGIIGDDNTSFKNCKYFIATAPLYQQIIDWFREKHDIYIIPGIQFEPAVEVEEDEEPDKEVLDNIYFILNLKEMRENKESYLPYIESTDKFSHPSKNDWYTSVNEAIEEAFKLI